MNSCYGCKFASKLRENHRKGDQVKCSKATELFGGEHWVNVLRSETGELLPSKCGQFEPGIEPTSKEVLKVKPQEEETYQVDYFLDITFELDNWQKDDLEEDDDYEECSHCGGLGIIYDEPDNEDNEEDGS